MFDPLYDIGDLWIVLIFAGFAVVCFVLGPLVGQRLGWTAPSKDRADYVLRAEATLISVTVLILAFSLVQVHGNLRRTEELIAKEAAQIDLMDRQLMRYGDPQVGALRQRLLAYAASIITDEWPALRLDRESPRTDELLGSLSRSLSALDPQAGRQTTSYGDLLKSLDALVDLREQRFLAAELKLPATFWYLTLVLMLTIVGTSTMIEPVSFHVVSLATQGLAMALLAALIFITDTPFKGQTSIAPAPFERALAVMQARI
jgi:hypothetical protein